MTKVKLSLESLLNLTSVQCAHTFLLDISSFLHTHFSLSISLSFAVVLVRYLLAKRRILCNKLNGMHFNSVYDYRLKLYRVYVNWWNCQ